MNTRGSLARFRRRLAVVALLAFGSQPDHVHAEPEQAARKARPRVVVVIDVGNTDLVGRIRSELTAMGFDAILEIGRVTPAGLAGVAARTGAVAAATLETEVPHVRLWLFDRTTRKTLMREVTPQSAETAGLALHIVELLRASLLELSLPDAPRGDVEASPSLLETARLPGSTVSPDSTASPPGLTQPMPSAMLPAPPPSASAPPARTPEAAEHEQSAASSPFLVLEFGPGIIAGAGGLRPLTALGLGIGTFLSRRFRLGALGLIPLGSLHHRGDAGSSETKVTLVGAEACFVSLPETLRTFACAGPVFAWFETRGQAPSVTFEAGSDTAYGFGGSWTLGAALALGHELWFSAALGGGVLQRYLVVDYADQEAVRWGPWFGLGTLTLQGEFE